MRRSQQYEGFREESSGQRNSLFEGIKVGLGPFAERIGLVWLEHSARERRPRMEVEE